MDNVFRLLLALFTALSSVTGAPVDSIPPPDRPIIVAPTVTMPTELVEIDGLVESIQGDTFVVNGFSVVVGPFARVKGDLQVGASVRVVASNRGDGNWIARAISVGYGAEASVTPQATLTSPAQPRSTERPEAQPTRRATPEPTEKPEVHPTERPAPDPTEKPEAHPTVHATPGPTEKPEAKPTERRN
jgi:hypothetical protein